MRTEIRKRMRRAGCWLALAGLTSTSAFGAAPRPRHEVRLLGSVFTPAAGVSADAVRELAGRANAVRQRGQATVHALVQLHQLPDESERADLSRSGLDLGAFIPGNAFIAAIPADRIEAAAGRPEVRWIEPWTAARKLHPRLRAGKIGAWARDPERPEWVMAMVLLHHDVDLARGERLAEAVGGVAMDPVEGVHGLTIWLPESKLAALADEEEVLWIEEGPLPLSPTNDGIRSQMKASLVTASPYDLGGQGVRLFVFDGGRARATHETFDAGNGSRLTTIDSAGFEDHATHVAGTAAGDGSGSDNGRGRGVAPEATLFSAGYQQVFGSVFFWDNAGDIENDYALARSAHSVDLANNSLSSNIARNGEDCDIEGDYGTASSLLDGIVRGANPEVGSQPMIVTWANGNERGGNNGRCGANYHTTPEPACAKNPIHVGALNSDGGAMTWFSSWGPCDDGRLKPIVSAPGCETGRVTGEAGIYSSVGSGSAYDSFDWCGTSMATPAVSGAIALLIEDWRLHGHNPPFPSALTRPLPALVKSMLIHTARDLGLNGPDYRFGYGAVDARALIDLQRAGTGALGGPGLKVWGTDSISTGQTDSFTFTVPSGVGEIKATLAWDDAAAAAFAADALVNDLDLELVGPDNTVYHPWILDPASPQSAATTGVNVLDNQEQALVKNPGAGVWTVRVLGTSVPTAPQSYGLVYTATPQQYDERACTPTASGFESGNDGWTLTGATRVAAPAPGHGAFSIKLGGANNTTHEVQRTFSLPWNSKATWIFDLFMTTNEGAEGWGYDQFSAEVRNSADTVLAVVNFNNDGDLESTWLAQRNLDLTPWAGQTVKLVFRGTTDGALSTTFWIDDVKVTTCPAGSDQVSAPFSSVAAQDGFVQEATETSGTGGTAYPNNPPIFGLPASFTVGDSGSDQQIKGFVSFDTSSLPDGATVVWARLKMRRTMAEGTNPFTTHGACRVDIRTSGFNGNTSLEPADFQALATAELVSVCSDPVFNGGWAYATLNGAGLAAINKTGTTQLRIAFTNGDDDDATPDVIRFSAGEEAVTSYRPQLDVLYLP
jgi:hypothetical protein